MRLLLLCLACWTLACGSSPPDPPVPPDAPPAVAAGSVKTGAQVLAEEGFARLAGRRVGLIVNHTARVGTTHLIDLLHDAPNVELAALFGPEHGLRGTADAGETVSDGRDDRTGVPVYSLYGETRKPTPAMLAGLDVLVFDIQDVGARFYTYISTMGLAMQAAAEAGLPFVVLDRPNPLGGAYVSGFVLEPAHTSFVGQYPIPVAHGLTVGELATMIRDEGWLPGLETLQLDVVEIQGWTRTTQWPATGLPWLPPSPNIPTFETALVYPGACFFEATAASEGRGTETPFTLLGAPWADADALADTLNARDLPGVRFEAAHFTPHAIEGMAASPKLQDVPLHGVRYVVSDPAAFLPVETGIHVLSAFRRQAEAAGASPFVASASGMDRLAGTDRLRLLLKDGASPEAIIAAWHDEADAFLQLRVPYLRY